MGLNIENNRIQEELDKHSRLLREIRRTMNSNYNQVYHNLEIDTSTQSINYQSINGNPSTYTRQNNNLIGGNRRRENTRNINQNERNNQNENINCSNNCFLF